MITRARLNLGLLCIALSAALSGCNQFANRNSAWPTQPVVSLDADQTGSGRVDAYAQGATYAARTSRDGQPTYSQQQSTDGTYAARPQTRSNGNSIIQPVSYTDSNTDVFSLPQPDKTGPAERHVRGQTPDAGSNWANTGAPGSANEHYRYGMPPSGGARVAQAGVAPLQNTPPGVAPLGGAPFTGPSGDVFSNSSYDDSATIPFQVELEEERTGRFIFGVGVNSDAGVTGQVVVDEQNFDWRSAPRSWNDVWDGNAFRGGGQRFRVEAMPGDQVQRYLVSFTEPYLMDTQVSMGLSGSYYDRAFFDWIEQRVGGRASLGYRLSPDLSVSAAIRGERIKVYNPRVAGVPELDAALGDNNLFGFQGRIAHDTRDVPFAPTEGHLMELSFEQVTGTFDYSRFELDYRQHFLLFERPDSSGRHTLSYLFRVGATGSQTPIFENYFAGGFSTLRGFDFRGASPVSGSVIVGGEFRFLGSVEYMMPLTADDMIKGVVFCDFGTVEESIEINGEDYRVAVGTGLRISIPALGPAPLALDFAFPLAKEDTDDEQMFSFFFGLGRG